MEQKEFDLVVTPDRKWYELNIKEVLKYKDLIFLFVKRDFTAQYKQTILGPLWYIINPLISSFISTIIFSNIAHIDSEGVPYFLFYLAGYTLWNYFAICITSTANTFTANAGIMGKVYFPRLTMPIASVIYAAINMLIVFFMTIITVCIYAAQGLSINLNWTVVLIPLYMIQTAALGLGVGIIVSSLTTKYRDLSILVGFGVNLWMYITPVVYPISIAGGILGKIIMLNPMSPIIQNFKYSLLGIGEIDYLYWGISIIVTFVIDLFGILLFNKVEKTFMDTV